MRDPTKRFSDRAENYTKYRPSYPDAMVLFFRTLFPPPSTIADVGSGTGILTRQLLSHGYELYAVEPNEAMRQEAEKASMDDPHFHSVDGKAEATRLANRSVDFITCAQAFHWFDRVTARLEFCRILKENGLTALIWNERADESSMVNRQYDRLLERMALEYQNVNHRRIALPDIQAFFAPGEVELRTFPNEQTLDREGFLGRLLSSSYVPNLGQPGHQEIIEAAAEIFDAYQVDGKITFDYETKVFVGRFS